VEYDDAGANEVDSYEHHVEKLLQATKLRHIINSPDKHCSEYYNDITREIVAQCFARDVARFGYTPDEVPAGDGTNSYSSPSGQVAL
jgi:hypothetical protein